MTIKTNLVVILCYSDELERPAHLMLDAEEEAAPLVLLDLAQLDFLDDDSTIDTCFDCDSTISDQSSLLESIGDEDAYSDDDGFEEDSLVVHARRIRRRELSNQSRRSTITAADDDISSLQDSLVLSRRSKQTTTSRLNGQESYPFDDDSLIQSRNRLRRSSPPRVRSSAENTDIDSVADVILGECCGELLVNFDNNDSEETDWPSPKPQLLDTKRPNNRRNTTRRKRHTRGAHQ
jgi:hypothetical protein